MLNEANATIATHNIDILFEGVEFMKLPKILRGLTLYRLQESLSVAVYEIVSSTHTYSVAAESCQVTDNDWDIFESPIEFRSQYKRADA